MSANKVSFVFLSDLHLTEHGLSNRELVDTIADLHPDFILAGGDMITAKEGYATTIAEEVLHKLAKDFPVYCALGNHEQRLKVRKERFGDTYELYIRHLQASGVQILDNESLNVEVKGEKLRLYGLSLPLEHYRRFSRHELPKDEITKRIGQIDKTYFNLLMAHNPRFAETYFAWGSDLILSGHVHGGVMRFFKKALISPDFQFFPKYGYGQFVRNRQNMLVSGGLGEHTIPFRVFNPKELLYIEIIQEVSHGDSR